ncbi:hypothetical protein TNCV_1793461 [Trichonephila clavipes]|nr:hypothetical protein TNCV_1793461 [Trichonephila clavipes]
MMLWDTIGYTSRSPLDRIDGILNSAHYIYSLLRLVALHFIRAMQKPTFQQDNVKRMLPVLYGLSLIRKMFGFCPDLHVHQISHQ